MAKAKTSNTGMRNGKMFCFNCGGSFDLQLPQPAKFAADMMKSFDKAHLHCPKTWEEPKADANGKTEDENAEWWLIHGERGISSETMFHHLSGRRIGKYESHPHDPADFSRCYKLLEAVPQWRPKLHRMNDVSPVWKNLVDNWPKLEEYLLDQYKTNKANGMYEFMKTLGC